MRFPWQNDREGPPPGSVDVEGVTTWAVDAQGRIDSVGGLWVSFAQANQGEDTLPPGILGRSILDFISPAGAREMVQYLIETVHRVGTPLRVPYRCDSPGELRRFELTIHPRPDGGTQFESRIQDVVIRDRPLEILDAAAERSDEQVILCAWCKAVEDPEESGKWDSLDAAIRQLNLLDPPFPQLSHGLCPSCHDALMAQTPDAPSLEAQP
jgi:hypothetical protein